MTKLTENIFAIEVPSMAFGFMINNYGDESELMYMVDVAEITDLPEHKHDESLIIKKLGPGSYSFNCTSTDITGKQAAKIVDVAIHMEDYERMVKDGWWNYEDGKPYKTALESFHSLLRSKSLGRVVIIKKV